MSTSPLHLLRERKRHGERIVMVSLYDAPSAMLCCDAGVDVLLVGDSLGNVILGYDDTIPVTLDDMAHHTGAVARGARRARRVDVPVLADLPFGSWHGGRDSIVTSGARLMQAGAHGLKLEGENEHTCAAVGILSALGAPVMGHLGFTPQSARTFESVVQGKTAAAALRLLESALRLQDAGVCGIVLEVVPAEVAAEITARLEIPTIGIGAGPHCDGQVLVWHDLTGQTHGPALRFVKRYADGAGVLGRAVEEFAAEVRAGLFPTTENGWNMTDAESQSWQIKAHNARRRA